MKHCDSEVLSVSTEVIDVENTESIYVEGSKGGEQKPHTPYETPNNLLSIAYAKVLVAVAEGELAGTPTGRDIYLNGTPLIGPDGSNNFGGVTWEWRSGSQKQNYIQGIPEVSNETTVNFTLTHTTPWVRQLTKTSLSAARVTIAWPALLQQLQNGDTVGYSISYSIEVSTDGGPYVKYQDYVVSGKTNTTYERTHRINLPPNPVDGWTIRVRRNTPVSQSGNIQDTMSIKSFAEVVDAKQSYPNTALLFVQFDSRLFGGGQIPRISVKTKGRTIRVPDNYDPESRTYSGIWSGAFKWAWTDNPAWVFYDIVTQDRFGLGNRVNANQVSKWELYDIAQYCDVLVDDGTGSGRKEPRYTCNIYLQQVADAWQVLRDICSIFNGMTYWDGNQFVAAADKPEPISNIPIFSRSNVIGNFDYQTTDERSIYTSALISYDEPTDHYNTQVEASWERSEIVRWKGDRQVSLAAIGCTSRGEAQRKGKYTLLTNMLNRTVTFRTGLQGLARNVLPGSIIGVADPLIAGKPFTGRLIAGTRQVITLDRETEAKAGDVMYIMLTTGEQEGRTIREVAGRIVTVTTPYSEIPQKDAVWYLEASDLKSQLFRVTRIANSDDGVYDISGVEYNESKYNAVDNGARLEERPISKVPPSFILPPKPISVSASSYIEQTMSVTTMLVSWSSVENAVLYEGQFRVGQGDWVDLGTTGANEFNVKGIYSGDYLVRVRSINALGVKSIWGMSETTTLAGKVGTPPTVAFLETQSLLFGIRLTWGYKEFSEDTAKIEIRYSETASFEQSIKLGDYAYPQSTHDLLGLSAGKIFFFWCRLIDRTGNIGPWYPSETGLGIQGSSAENAGGQYNEYFAGLIGNTALDSALYERIELIDGNGPGSVNERLETAVTDLEGQIANITDALVYDPAKTYVKDDIVRSGSKLYQAQGDVPLDTPPPNPLYWKDVGTILQEANGLASQVEVNTQKIEEVDGKITATASSIESLQAAYRDDDGNGALDDALVGWDSRAQIITEREVRASETQAIAQQLVSYKAEIDGNKASITDLTQVVADNDSATSTRLESLEVKVDNDIQAAIRSEEQARVDADGALASRIDTTQAAVGENTASIQQTSEAVVTIDGKVSSSYTLKIDAQQNGQYVAAGIGLGIENGPAGLQSQFLVRADRFAVVDGTTNTTSAPFVVENGQVFIKDALIANGSIDILKIGSNLHSSNYIPGVSGWAFLPDGTFQMMGNTPGGNRLMINNSGVFVYYANGVKAIDLSVDAT